MERDGYACQAYDYGFAVGGYCQGGMVVHHRKVKGMGGSADPAINQPDNLVVLCDWHHKEVHSNPRLAYEYGLLLRHTT